MNAIRLLRRIAFAPGLMLCGALAIAAADASDTPAPDEKTVLLDKVVVEAVPDYRPIEPGWYHAKTAHFDVYARDAKIGRKIAGELIEVRGILEIIWPAVLTVREAPITIVGCSGQKEFHDWTAQPLTDISSTLAGPPLYILVNADLADIQTEARRAYLLALLNRIPGMKRWLAEGIANIIKGAEYADGKIQLGENKRPGLTQLATAELKYIILVYEQQPDKDIILKQEDALGIARNGRALPGVTRRLPIIYPKGYPETIAVILQELHDELDLRENNYYHNDPSRGFAEFFEVDEHAKLFPIFDDATPDTPQFRMFCWAFVHLCLYGDDNKYTKSLFQFVDLLNAGQPPERAFQAAYGMSTAKFEDLIRYYADKGQYKVSVFRLTTKTLSKEEVQFRSIDDAAILPVKATVLLKTGQKDAAKALLARACASPTSRTSASLCLLASLTADPQEALKLLETAAKNGPLDGQSYYRLAKARFDTAPKPLTPRQTIDVLKPAFAALQQESTPQNYLLIADAWLASSVIEPTAANLAVIDPGAQLYPNDPTLKERVDALRQRFPKN
jgi:hypothetical protein